MVISPTPGDNENRLNKFENREEESFQKIFVECGLENIPKSGTFFAKHPSKENTGLICMDAMYNVTIEQVYHAIDNNRSSCELWSELFVITNINTNELHQKVLEFEEEEEKKTNHLSAVYSMNHRCFQLPGFLDYVNYISAAISFTQSPYSSEMNYTIPWIKKFYQEFLFNPADVQVTSYQYRTTRKNDNSQETTPFLISCINGHALTDLDEAYTYVLEKKKKEAFELMVRRFSKLKILIRSHFEMKSMLKKRKGGLKCVKNESLESFKMNLNAAKQFLTEKNCFETSACMENFKQTLGIARSKLEFYEIEM